MLSLSTAVSRGYHWHFGGIVEASRFEGLRDKFARLYATEGVKAPLRSMRKKQGIAAARFFAHPAYRSPHFFWWVLLTDGEHPAREREKLLDGRERRQRIAYGGEFEIVSLPAVGGAPRWTWRITTARMDTWKAEIITAIRHRKTDRAIVPVIIRYHRLPGFRGVRQQIGELRLFTQGEWQRTKGTPEKCPFLPKTRPPYVRFRSWPGVESGLVVARLLNGQTPFSPDMIVENATKEEMTVIEHEAEWAEVVNE